MFTFRAWNPEDLAAKLGEEKAPLQEKGLFAFRNSIEVAFEEPMSKQELMATHKSKLSKGAWISKMLGFVLLYIGLFLIVEPTFLTLQKTPLITYLQKSLGNSTIFAFVFIAAMGMLFFMSAQAWIKQRPLYAILTLSIAMAIVYFTFFFEYEAPLEAQSVTYERNTVIQPTPA